MSTDDFIPEYRQKHLRELANEKDVHVTSLCDGRQATMMQNILEQSQIAECLSAIHPTGNTLGLWVDPDVSLGLPLRWLPGGCRAKRVDVRDDTAVILLE